MKLIGIAGAKRSGKDTAAAALTNKGWASFTLASTPVRHVTEVNPYLSDGVTRFADVMSDVGWDGAKSTVHAGEMRRLVIAAGDSLRGMYGTDAILGPALRAMREAAAAGAHGFVITDVRHEDEAAFVRDRSGLVVQVVRPGVVADRSHWTEMPLGPDMVGVTVENSGTVADLHRDIERIAEGWGSARL